jgi:hypothetical protein
MVADRIGKPLQTTIVRDGASTTLTLTPAELS